MARIEVGGKAVMKQTITEPASGDHPERLMASKGQVVVVERISCISGYDWMVKPEHWPSFLVKEDEIEPVGNPPRLEQYSTEYNDQIEKLAYHFLGCLVFLPPLEVTERMQTIGTDMLDGDYLKLVNHAFDAWLKQHNYELSYNQMNVAFWWAVDSLKEMEVKDETDDTIVLR